IHCEFLTSNILEEMTCDLAGAPSTQQKTASASRLQRDQSSRTLTGCGLKEERCKNLPEQYFLQGIAGHTTRKKEKGKRQKEKVKARRLPLFPFAFYLFPFAFLQSAFLRMKVEIGRAHV